MNKCKEYTVCACNKSGDLHCMYCCKLMDTHKEIPEEQVLEIQRRILAGADYSQ